MEKVILNVDDKEELIVLAIQEAVAKGGDGILDQDYYLGTKIQKELVRAGDDPDGFPVNEEVDVSYLVMQYKDTVYTLSKEQLLDVYDSLQDVEKTEADKLLQIFEGGE